MDNIAEVAKTFFGGVWKLLMETDFPGTTISLASVSISILIASFSIRIFGFLSGFGLSSTDYGRAADSADRVRKAYKWEHRNKIGF